MVAKKDKPEDILFTAVLKILTPLVRILLRNGVPHGVFNELAKRAYVKVAADQFRVPGRKQSVSHISTITGLTRKEVLRIRTLPKVNAVHELDHYNRAARVISAWAREPEFLDKRGQPMGLPFNGSEYSFSALTKRFSGDIPARAILDELKRVEAVRILKDGRISLVSRAYISKGDDLEKISILGSDVSDLMTTIDHNIALKTEPPLFQRKVCYNNIPNEVFAELQKIIVDKAQSALEDMDQEMAKRDRDCNKEIEGKGQNRAGIGIYYFKEPKKIVENEPAEDEA